MVMGRLGDFVALTYLCDGNYDWVAVDLDFFLWASVLAEN